MNKTYKWANNICGWLVFAAAAVTYLLTIESSASFWDCGEFIASAYKLEVGHPPGNPIFMLVANLFTQLAADPSMVPIMVNAMSALFSALTILFLFWTITHLVRKLVFRDGEEKPTLAQIITVLGSGVVGALAYTFSDTFWFSAVEGEVYAFSSMMTALVFWLILKWEDVADEPHSDRWLILIAYLMGISIAVHLLNLLCIPAIVLVFYFKRYKKPTIKGALIALVVSAAVVVAILYGMIQGIMEVCGWFELLFVNVFHLPYNSGTAFYVILIFGVLSWAIWETHKNDPQSKRAKIAFILSVFLLGIPFFGSHYIVGIVLTIAMVVLLFGVYKKINMAILNTTLISLLMITIGYSSYALILIRSSANTPMDQNSPEDVFTLRTYLSREQYGETPLFYGPTFVSEVKYDLKGNYYTVSTTDKGPVWTQIAKHDESENDRYFVSKRKESYNYVDKLNTLFPRMYSQDPRHIEGYKMWSNYKGTPVSYDSPQGRKTAMKPTAWENLSYFFNYQVNFMYWRYFMWNFSGRQNDIQGDGDIMNGNWITGIKFLDEARLGSQDNMPDSVAKNKGHNKYYMLPLLLGLIGIFFQISSKRKGAEQFWITFLLFFMTGLAIVLYLNQPPFQPRERDYAYAGSFYAFAIWIGLGVGGIVQYLNKLKLPSLLSASLASLLCLLIPLQMLSQNWDDHNRSGRKLARDFGYNYLVSCEKNAIIFTNGDNDTFPLWYGQEVEGFRTDVRVCNLSYLQTDWYIDQMKRQAYESDPLPIDWKKYDYIQGKHDVVRLYPQERFPFLEDSLALEWIKSDDPRTKTINNQEIDYLPTNVVLIPIDSAAVIKSGIVKPEYHSLIPKAMVLDWTEKKDASGRVTERAKSYLGKQELMILDMLKNNRDWSRPIYYAVTVSSELYMGLERYFRRDGMAYRIMPYQAGGSSDVEILYDNLMNKYRWGGMDTEDLYIDRNSLNMAESFRMLFGKLSKDLISKGDTTRAKLVLDTSLVKIPARNVPYDYRSTADIAEAYSLIGDTVKSRELFTELFESSLRSMDWFDRLNEKQYANVFSYVHLNVQYLQMMILFCRDHDTELYNRYLPEIEKSFARYEQYYRRIQQGGYNK